MRRSPLKHPLAVLRTELGLGQTEFGEKVGRHWRTIQSIELGKLPLSAKLAERISLETEVHMDWLMGGDPEAPIIDARGLQWKKEAFFDAQGRKLLPGTTQGRHYPTDLLSAALARLCAAVVAATESENVRAHGWQVSNAIEKSAGHLPAFKELMEEFLGILVHNFKDSAAGREAMIGYAVQRIRRWKEPRRRSGKRLKAKRKG